MALSVLNWLIIRSEKYWTSMLLCLATIVRMAYWMYGGGVKTGGDSASYLQVAESISKFELQSLVNGTHHPLISILLAPSFVLPISFSTYFLALELVLSVGACLFVFLIVRSIVSQRSAYFALLVAAVYPSLLFWFPFVLSDTMFIFCLGLFLLVFIRMWVEPKFATRFLAVLAGALLLLARPHSVAILAVAIFALFIKAASLRYQGKHLCLVSLAACSLVFASVGGAFVLMPQLRARVQTIPAISLGLWFSTQSATNVEEMIAVETRWHQIGSISHPLPEGKTEFNLMLDEASAFIQNHPATYAKLVVIRFFSFWFPWLFATGWSNGHLLLDFLLSLFFTAGTFLYFPLISRERSLSLVFIGMALGIAIMCSFSAVDTDTRYRLPAEFLLILVAPAGWLNFMSGYYNLKIGSSNSKPLVP